MSSKTAASVLPPPVAEASVVARLAHEIRNPLTTIKLLFDNLVASRLILPKGKEDAEMIGLQIARLETLLSEVLRSARDETQAPVKKQMDLNVAANESLLLLASGAKKGTRLDLRLSSGSLPVFGDAVQITQVVYNLALNALQAVGERGRVVALSGREKRADDDRDWVFFELSDDGPGLPPEIASHLYEPFVTTKPDGVGLGLTIVKRIVDAHGGEIAVESPRRDTGVGTRFRVWLPELIEYHI